MRIAPNLTPSNLTWASIASPSWPGPSRTYSLRLRPMDVKVKRGGGEVPGKKGALAGGGRAQTPKEPHEKPPAGRAPDWMKSGPFPLLSRFVFERVSRRFLEDGKSGLQVVRQRNRMIVATSVQPQALRLVAPRLIDGPQQEILAEPLPDELRSEPELNDFDLAFHASVELAEPSRNAVNVEDMHFVLRIPTAGRQFGVAQPLAAPPIPRRADRVVKEAVIRDGRILRLHDRQPAARRVHGSLHMGKHLHVGCLVLSRAIHCSLASAALSADPRHTSTTTRAGNSGSRSVSSSQCLC